MSLGSCDKLSDISDSRLFVRMFESTSVLESICVPSNESDIPSSTWSIVATDSEGGDAFTCPGGDALSLESVATDRLVETTTTAALVCATGVVAAGAGLGVVFGVGVGVGVGAGLGVEVVRGGAGATVAGLSSMKAYGHLCTSIPNVRKDPRASG